MHRGVAADGSKDFVIVDAMFLLEFFCDKACFVPLDFPLLVSFDFERPTG